MTSNWVKPGATLQAFNKPTGQVLPVSGYFLLMQNRLLDVDVDDV